MGKEKVDKKTYFQDSWLKDPKFRKWLKKHTTNKTKFRCKLCQNKEMTLSNMGTSALTSHAKSSCHIKVIQCANPLSRLFLLRYPPNRPQSSSHPPNPQASSHPHPHSSRKMKMQMKMQMKMLQRCRSMMLRLHSMLKSDGPSNALPHTISTGQTWTIDYCFRQWRPATSHLNVSIWARTKSDIT